MLTTVTDALDRTAQSRADLPALVRKQNGHWEPLNWRDYRSQIRLAARALISLGVQPGEHVTILGYNCVEWFVADIGAIVAGAIPAGIYTTSTPEQCRFIGEHCETRVAFVENEEQLDKFRAVRSQLPSLRALVMMHGQPTGDDVLSWQDFLRLGERISETELDARAAAQRPDDVCTIIYTSGTTGVPKAVMLTHRNITFIADRASEIAGIMAGDVIVSYLPLSHVAEQLFSLHSNAVAGTTIWFAESMERLPDALRAARPHHFLAVPRVWEKIQSKIEAVGAKNSPMKKRIAAWARGIGLAAGYADQRGESRPIMFGLANRLVFSKVRATLGLDRTRTLVTGAAPTSVQTLEFFLSLGMPICEVYGMSESTAAATVSTPQRYRTGKAGFVLPGTEVRIAEDGEVCIRGPNVFKGYYKDPDGTREAIDADGWLHSGDIGELDAEGFLRITDRKKDLIITAGGENIAPQYVEGQLKSIPVVSQAVVVGDRQRFLSALLTLDPEKIPATASAAGSQAKDAAQAAQCARFTAHIQHEIDGVNQRLARVQTVKKFVILDADLSIEGGELTPTMKLKRNVIAQKYADVIQRLYARG